MQFETKAQQACYEKILPWMKELFGEAFVLVRDDAPRFVVHIGSALVETVVQSWTEDEATILSYSWVVTGAEVTPDLMRYLLTENLDMRFGAFAMDDKGNILFQHTLVGSTCDKAELRTSVRAVVLTADHYDDQIIKGWGGQSALDRMR